ncbi:lysoplasmalogenase [Peribacillus muralis]|uniref:lysoplasmalogenase family protein n=1 Tax=Peribacillus muralis TaxID=264697 RepID=UPI001F1C8126
MSFSWLRFATIVPIAVYSTVIGREIVLSLIDTGETGLIIPVIGYVTVISLMGWTAIMSGNATVITGGILFVISDSILAWNKFIDVIAFSGPLIMLTYYASQFFVADSIRSVPSFGLANDLKNDTPIQ